MSKVCTDEAPFSIGCQSLWSRGARLGELQVASPCPYLKTSLHVIVKTCRHFSFHQSKNRILIHLPLLPKKKLSGSRHQQYTLTLKAFHSLEGCLILFDKPDTLILTQHTSISPSRSIEQTCLARIHHLQEQV